MIRRIVPQSDYSNLQVKLRKWQIINLAGTECLIKPRQEMPCPVACQIVSVSWDTKIWGLCDLVLVVTCITYMYVGVIDTPCLKLHWWFIKYLCLKEAPTIDVQPWYPMCVPLKYTLPHQHLYDYVMLCSVWHTNKAQQSVSRLHIKYISLHSYIPEI